MKKKSKFTQNKSVFFPFFFCFFFTQNLIAFFKSKCRNVGRYFWRVSFSIYFCHFVMFIFVSCRWKKRPKIKLIFELVCVCTSFLLYHQCSFYVSILLVFFSVLSVCCADYDINDDSKMSDVISSVAAVVDAHFLCVHRTRSYSIYLFFRHSHNSISPA